MACFPPSVSAPSSPREGRLPEDRHAQSRVCYPSENLREVESLVHVPVSSPRPFRSSKGISSIPLVQARSPRTSSQGESITQQNASTAYLPPTSGTVWQDILHIDKCPQSLALALDLSRLAPYTRVESCPLQPPLLSPPSKSLSRPPPTTYYGVGGSPNQEQQQQQRFRRQSIRTPKVSRLSSPRVSHA